MQEQSTPQRVDRADADQIVERRVEVTPRQASEWLLLNQRNRPLRRAKVAEYADDMANGRWRYTGDPVRFGTDHNGDEVLIDGQHRLSAVIRAKTPVLMKVEWGYSPETQRFVDIGIKRQLADQLTIEDIPHGKYLSALARRIYAYTAHGVPTLRGGASPEKQREVLIDPETGRVRPLIGQAAEYASRHPRGLIPASGLSFLFWLLVPLGNESAIEFLDRADDGAGLPPKASDGSMDPVLALRDRIIRERSSGARVQDHVAIAYGIVAWNARIRGRQVKLLRLPGLTSATFPKPDRPNGS